MYLGYFMVRHLKFERIRRYHKQYVCKHSSKYLRVGVVPKNIRWLKLKESNGETYYWCEDCIEERLPFMPTKAIILRGKHYCEKCDQITAPVIGFISEFTAVRLKKEQGVLLPVCKNYYVCLECFKKAALERE